MSPLRVLIADDDASTRGLVRAVLRQDGFEVDEASNGNEVLLRMRTARYDVVILDLMMGPGSGRDVLEKVREERAGEKFIIIVSATSQAAIDKLDSDKIFAKLRKPFDINELLRAVRASIAAEH